MKYGATNKETPNLEFQQLPGVKAQYDGETFRPGKQSTPKGIRIPVRIREVAFKRQHGIYNIIQELRNPGIINLGF